MISEYNIKDKCVIKEKNRLFNVMFPVKILVSKLQS